MQPRTTHRRSPQENGDVESSNGGLKRALEQQLLLRGSRDFATLADYEAFVQRVLQQRNQARQARLAEELAVMRPLPATAELPIPTSACSRPHQPDPQNTHSVPTA